jgi:hypothetical protein
MSIHRGAVSGYIIPGHNVCGSPININTERIPIKLMLNEPSFKLYKVNCTHKSSGTFLQIVYFKHLTHIHIQIQNLQKQVCLLIGVISAGIRSFYIYSMILQDVFLLVG